MATKKQTYNEDDIQVFAGLEGIRRKPSMYLGDMNEATWTCVREVADNCQDEFLAGRNDSCMIVYDGEYVWVVDKGEGIPVKTGKVVEASGKTISESRLTSIVSRIHAGGKFTDNAYKVSAGTHGVGIKAVNAVSSSFEVWTCRDKAWHHTAYKQGKEVSGVTKCKAPRIDKIKYTPKVGTVVRFSLDKKIFPKGAAFNDADAHKWADFNSHLNAGFKIVIVGEDGESKTYHQPDGLWALLEKRYLEYRGDDAPYDDEIKGWGDNGAEIELERDQKMWLDYAFILPQNVEGCYLDLYTNGVSNPDGGVHQEAFWSAFMKALSHHAPARAVYSLQDVREGMIGIVNIKINEPSFNNQTKEKLVDTRVKKPLEQQLFNDFDEFFRSHKAFTKELCNRASEFAKLRGNLALQKKTLLTLKKATQSKPTKFAGVTGKVDKSKVEIYLVEGDSAGGSAKQARYRDFQGVLPLKGKPLNVMKADDARALVSEEITNIFSAIGYVPDGSSKPDGFGKLILLSDSDTDGYHINALVLTVIQKYCPELIVQGKVFVANTDHCKLYGRGRKGDYYFGSTPDAVHERAKEAGDSISGKTSYLKGWGELNAEGLRPAAMNPETRRLIQITSLNPKQTKEFHDLMGDDVQARRQLIGI